MQYVTQVRRLALVVAVVLTTTMVVTAPLVGASTVGSVDATGPTSQASPDDPLPPDDDTSANDSAGEDDLDGPTWDTDRGPADEDDASGFGDRESRPARRLPEGSPPDDGNVTTVTLVTGQTVYVTNVSGERRYSVQANGSMEQVHTPQGTYVFPSNVDFSKIDRDLFNVDLLIQQDLTDSESSSVPVIVESKARNRKPLDNTQRAFESATGNRPDSHLDSIGAVAGEIGKGNARSASRKLVNDRSVAKVHLDVKYEVTLDEANQLVNASTARKEYGASGENVTIAVLDTGVNESHPALDDDEVLEKDFTDENTTDDLVGHGTHVAGIITADPAASNGTYSGIAPNASIMDLRVLGEDGYGRTSWIISAMEYATDNGADAISMSLSGGIRELRSNSPYADAVNYSVDNGTPVVVSAANSGPGYSTLGDPSVQRKAITVGASDKSLGIADFSSRGPTNGYFVKPDLVATGVSVASTDASSDGYVSYSGTSMSAPVVSGAVALLLERHPSWSPDRVKNSLVSTADPLGDQDVYTQGAGQLNVTAAIDPAVVVDEAVIDYGKYTSNTTATRTFTVTNTGNSTRTFSLSASAADIADGSPGSVSLNTTSVTLDPGNSTTVALAVVTGDDLGIYSGRVSVDGGAATAIFGYTRAYELTIGKRAIRSTAIDYDSVAVQPNHSGAFAAVSNTWRSIDNGTDTVTYDIVSEGSYIVMSQGFAEDENQPIVIARSVDVTGNTQVTLDESNTVERAVDMTQPESVSGPLAISYVEVRHEEYGPNSDIWGHLWHDGPDTSTVRLSAQQNFSVATERAFVTEESLNYTGGLNSSDVYYLYDATDGVDGPRTEVIDTSDLGKKAVTYHRTRPGERYQVAMSASDWSTRVNHIDAQASQYSHGIGDRIHQTVYVSPEASSHTISVSDTDATDGWELYQSNGITPAAGNTAEVSVNRHPLVGDVNFYFASDGDMYSFGDGQVSSRYAVLNSSGRVTLTVNGTEEANVTFDDGSFVENTNVGAGSDIVVQTTTEHGVMPRSTKTVTTARTTYRPDADSEPPAVESMTVKHLDEHNRAPNGTTVVEVTARDYDSDVTNLTLLWAEEGVTSVPFDGSGVKSGTAWQEGRVVEKQFHGDYAALTVALNTSGYTGNVSLAARTADEHGNVFETTTYDATVVTGELTNEVTGTVQESDGTAAADDTIRTFETPHRTSTDASGSFQLGVADRSSDYAVGYLQADLDDANPTWARDGSPDVYALGNVSGDADSSLGTVTLPEGHVVDVRVVSDAGGNVSNATVEFVHDNSGADASHAFTTAEDGKVYAGANAVSGVEMTGEVTVVITPPDSPKYVSSTYVVDRNVTGDENITVTIEEAEYVRGQLDGADGSALTEDDVTVRSPITWDTGRGTTNQSGSFNVSVSEAGLYDVILTQRNETLGIYTERDGTPDVYTVDRQRVDGTADVGNVDLPQGYVVNVTVVDERGDPIANVTPYIEHQPDYASNATGHGLWGLETDENGRFVPRPDVSPGIELRGQVNVLFFPETKQYQRKWIQLNVTGDRDITVTLNDSYVVNGTVYENDGSVAVDDRVHSVGLNNDVTKYERTRSDGSFREGLPKNGTYDFVHVQRNESNGGATTQRDGSADIYTIDRRDIQGNDLDLGNVTLPEGHLVNVTVVNQSGEPVENVDVRFAHQPDYAPNATSRLYATTNSEGYVSKNGDVAPGVELNGTVQLTFDPPGTTYDRKTVEVNVTGDRQLDVTLYRAATINGTMEDTSGNALTRDYVLVGSPSTFDTGRTDETTGNYSVDAGDSGTYGVTFVQFNETSDTFLERDGVADLYYLGNYTLQGQTDVGTEQIPDGHVVNVTVVDESGSPVENASVIVSPSESDEGNPYVSALYFNSTADGDVGTNPNDTTSGIELAGDVTINVSRPEGDELFAEGDYVRNLTVTGKRNVTVTLEENEWSTLDQTWTFDTGGRLQHAQVAAGSDLVYAAGLDDTVYALNRSTGEIVWRFNRSGSLADSSPTLQGDTLFVGSGGGVVYALNASTGATEWTHQTDSAVVSSPTVDNGTVYVGSNDGTVMALSTASGSVQWTHETAATVLSKPAVGGGSVFVTTDGGDVVALDRATGSQQWTVGTGVDLGHSSPVVGDGTVVVAADEVYAIDAATGAVQWTTPYGGTAGATPALHDGTVYVGADNGTVSALSAATGAVEWQFGAGQTVSSTPAVANGRVVFGTLAGDVYLLNASTGSQLATSELASAVRTPATATVQAAFVGSRNGTVVALGNSSATSSSTADTTTDSTSDASSDGTTSTENADDRSSTDDTSSSDTTGESTDGTSTTADSDGSTATPTAEEGSDDATATPATETAAATPTGTPTPGATTDATATGDASARGDTTARESAGTTADSASSATPTAGETTDVPVVRAPGLGLLVALLALLGGGLVVARRRSGR